MSGKQSGLVWEIKLENSNGVSKDAKRTVLGAMADHADHDGNNVFPSIGFLAWKTELSTRQVVRVINSLIKDNLVELVDKRHNQYRTRHYKLTLSNAPRKPEYKPAQDSMSSAKPAHDKIESAHDKSDSAQDIRVSPYPSDINVNTIVDSDKQFKEEFPSYIDKPKEKKTTKEEWESRGKEIIANSGKNPALSSPRTELEHYIEIGSQALADCLDRKVVAYDKKQAKRAKELGIPLERLVEFCHKRKGTFKPYNGEDTSPYWVVTKAEEWKAKGYMDTESNRPKENWGRVL